MKNMRLKAKNSEMKAGGISQISKQQRNEPTPYSKNK